MHIEKENYLQFYFGIGTEYFFISKFYMLGFEAYKPSIDIGYDIIVNNKAKAIFEKNKYREKYLQVKSSIWIKNKTRFYIREEDFNKILNDENAGMILSLHKPILNKEIRSFDYYHQFTDTFWEDDLKVSWMRDKVNDYHKLKSESNDIFDFRDFKHKYFWLNNKQLENLNEKNLIFNKVVGKSEVNYKVIYIRIDEDHIAIVDEKNFCSKEEFYPIENQLIDEVKELYFLLNECVSRKELDKGKLLFQDTPYY